MSITISIIIPIFNRPISILNTLESIKKQNKKCEIIIVDDSNDQTSCNIEHFISKNKNIYIKHIRPKQSSNKNIGINGSNGANKNRNIGIKNSTGNIIVFLDSDDQLLEGALEDIENAFKKDKNLSLYLGSIKYKSGFQNNISTLKSGVFKEYLKIYWRRGEVLPAVKSSLIKQNDLYFPEDLICFENILYLELLKKGGNFFYSSKKVRIYDDISKNRLTYIIPSTNFRNMRNGYLRTLKNNWVSIILYCPIILLTNVIKIIIYNRLIKRKNYSFKRLISFLMLPLPRKIILQLKFYYDKQNNLYGIFAKRK